MTNVDDLNIETEIMPLMDFTLNHFARNVLLNLLLSPLPNIEAITERQEILKGILLNLGALKDYSYNKGDLPEVRHFLEKLILNEEVSSTSRLGYWARWQFDKNEKLRFRTSITQSIRLFYRLQNQYFDILKIDVFPIQTRLELQQICTLFEMLNVKKYENKIIENRLTTNDIIDFILLVKTKVNSNLLSTFWHNLFLFEAYLSIAKAINNYNFTFPEFHYKEILELKDFYHPIFKNPVKNNLDNFKGNLILVTGPNMSGKSTLLRSLSLCVYMAHLGLAVPATSCKMPFFDTISVAINQHDDISNGYSQFMSEILALKSVAEEAVKEKRCFAVFDELFKGTNISDAIALSEKTIKGLAKFKRSFFLISTHLHPLKDILSETTVATCYLDCIIENNYPLFTYTLKEGWSDLRIGQIIFEQQGLNDLL